ncbi:hypothetical protein L3Q67_01710 [Saccharothrix sp. AJ9571]|nr:hypothetical protein L3Q67_01710 [Saccharothrix sp. AJ9571]
MTSVDDRETTTLRYSEVERARQEYEDFRTRVRDRAIRGYREAEMDLDRLNCALERLGLTPYVTRYSQTRVILTFDVRTPHDDADEAFPYVDRLRVNHASVQETIAQMLSDAVGTDAALIDTVSVGVGWPRIHDEEAERG